MAIDVYVVRHDDDVCDEEMGWGENEVRLPAPQDGYYHQFETNKWKDSLKWLRTRPHPVAKPPWVFLCLRGSHLAEEYRIPYLLELYKIAGHHSWAGDLFLLADERIALNPARITKIDSVFKWIDVAAAGGVTDLLELRFDRHSRERPNFRALQAKATEAHTRQNLLYEMLCASRRWQCFAPVADKLFPLISRYNTPEAQLSQADAALTVLYESVRLDLIKQHHAMLAQRGPHTVALCHPLYDNYSEAEVKHYCGQNEISLIEFRGPFELLFFLTKLKRECTPPRLVILPERTATTSPPVMLLVNVFEQEKDYVWAAGDMHRLKQSAPFGTKLHVNPALVSKELLPLLTAVTAEYNELSNLSVCYYLGHGHKTKGLQNGNGNQYESVDDWLKRFAPYEGALPLMFFAACHSAEFARRFAVERDTATVGFHSKVKPEACWYLAGKMVSAISLLRLDRQERNAAMKKAFEAGCAELRSRESKKREFSRSQPVFYPE